MATISNAVTDFLVNGDHLDQATFHAVYEGMPEHCRAELIGGVVYMASPMKIPHGKLGPIVSAWLSEYESETPGTEVLQGATAILGPSSEPEPDHCLRLLPEFGGASRTNPDDFLVGPPELVIEISHSTAAIDLHAKKDDYEAAGVREYLVLAVKSKEALWFQRRRGRFVKLPVDADGILRSRVFPGLWLDADGLFSYSRKLVLETLRRGLATKEHAAFVAKIG